MTTNGKPAKPVKADEIPLAEVAHILGMTYLSARDALFSGRLKGRKSGGRWLVTDASVQVLKKERQR